MCSKISYWLILGNLGFGFVMFAGA
uniref:Uncharacterized protein n=1 Tax=Anguilla anguilla TaxID=7936 RepID=A0A0E9UYF9_ANGAN